MCRQSREPRQRVRVGCRRAPHTRKATLQAPHGRGAGGPDGVGDLWQAQTHWARNPGGPASGLGMATRSARRTPRGTAGMYGCRASDRSIGLRKRQHNIPAGRRWRQAWREGRWPRGRRASTPGAGPRAGAPCTMRSTAYDRQRGRLTRPHGPRSGTMSMIANDSKRRTTDGTGTRHRASMARHGPPLERPWRPTGGSSPTDASGERITRLQSSGSTSRSRTGSPATHRHTNAGRHERPARDGGGAQRHL
jgi:hypothetical protein